MAVELKRRLFDVDEYHRMAEAGILTEDDRVELIDGEIVEMSPIGAPHARCVMFLNEVCCARRSPGTRGPSRSPATSSWSSRSPTPPSTTTAS